MTKQAYTIIQPAVEDAEALVAMHGRSWLDTYPNDEHGVSWEFIQETVDKRASEDGLTIRRGYIQESHINPDYYLRIAKTSQNEVVGFIDGRKSDTYDLGWFGDKKDIILTVVSYNGRAQKFYQKIGFEIVPGSEHFHDGTVIPVVDMIRKGEKQ